MTTNEAGQSDKAATEQKQYTTFWNHRGFRHGRSGNRVGYKCQNQQNYGARNAHRV